MKNKGIVLILIFLAVVIVVVMVGDFFSDRPDKSKANPYEYNIDEFKNADPSIVLYKESKNFKIGFEKPKAISIHNDKIYLAGDTRIKIIGLSGELLSEIPLPGEPHTVESTGDKIFVALKNQILVFSSGGEKIAEWNIAGENTFLTAIAAQNGNVFVADAGMRKVYRFSEDGQLLNEFEGKSGDDVLHGFIIPSPNFDLDINDEGELWVVNPGMHALENYTLDGNLRAHWKSTSMNPEGFSGCCNPAHFTFLADGSFVTSEKGLVRIKIHKPSGEFLGMVAAPSQFSDEGKAPDIAVDSRGNVYALDFEKNIVRVFEPKQGSDLE
jgi:hypothetical protein